MKKFFVLMILLFVFGTQVWSQKESRIPLIGSDAPSFTSLSTKGKINFPKDFGKSWKILFSHPQDFTPVCTTEILQLATMQDEFSKLDVKVAVISTDGLERHKQWIDYMQEVNYMGKGQQKIDFPLFADVDYTISKSYGMIHQIASTNKDIRGVFVIDPENKVRLINFYPMQIGRNMEEIKRAVIAMQTSDKDHVLTPANWVPGGDVLVPYAPYTASQLAADPSLAKGYYNLGNQVWFKKVSK